LKRPRDFIVVLRSRRAVYSQTTLDPASFAAIPNQ
jgi:hypothetical protein